MNFHANIGIYLFKDIVVNGNSLEVFGIGHCRSTSRSQGGFKFFLYLQLSSPISQLCHTLGSCD